MKSTIIDIPKGINAIDQKINIRELHAAINTASEDDSTSIRLYKNNEKEYTAIFSWQYKNKWKIDYPIEMNKIHKQIYTSLKNCLKIADYIFHGHSLDNIKGFIHVPIRHFTLDEMLEFKREDEMRLRGGDPDLDI